MQNRLNNDDKTVTTWRDTSAPVSLTTHSPDFDLLDAYLTTVRATLSGVSEAEARAILDEIQQHVLASAQGYEELGDAPDLALHNALAAFGAPQELGQSFSTTYQTTGTARTLPPWIALRRALRVLGFAHAITMSAWLMMVLSWSQGVAPPVASMILFVVLVVVPVRAGWRVGATANTPRASFGTFLALSLMALVSSPLLLLYLHLPSRYMPFNELVSLFPLLFVAWIPTACLAAGVGSFVTQHRARRLRMTR